MKNPGAKEVLLLLFLAELLCYVELAGRHAAKGYSVGSRSRRGHAASSGRHAAKGYGGKGRDRKGSKQLKSIFNLHIAIGRGKKEPTKKRNDKVSKDNVCPKTIDTNCQSCQDRYTTCPVFSADKILSITPIYKYTDKCEEGKTYGFEGRTIWTTLSCKAKFRVCYVAAKLYRDVKCTCAGLHYSECRIKVKGGEEVSEVVMMLRSSDGNCKHLDEPHKKKPSWGFNKDKNVIWVDQGCGGNFRVFYK